MFNNNEIELDDHEDFVVQSSEEGNKNKRNSSWIPFIKKHKLALAITIVIIGSLIASYNLIPLINTGELKLVNLNTPVELKEGQTVRLKNSNVTVKIAHFSNDTCPETNACFGSGPTVEYELVINGQKYATGSSVAAAGADYKVETISSDYKTSAIIKITKTENN